MMHKMKKTVVALIAVLAVMTMACQHSGKGTKDASKESEALIEQRVKEMMQMKEYYDADKLLTADLLAMQKKASSVHFWSVFFPGFQWDLGVMDACSENQEVKMEGVKLIDSLHCEVAMRYVDEGCYNDPYTLKLLKENGEWKIDDVSYNEGENSLRDDCQTFYADVVEEYRSNSPEEIMEFFMTEEPIEENYSDPECIYYNNPDAVRGLIEEIKSCHELFKQNPEYKEEYGQQIDAMVERIAAHL